MSPKKVRGSHGHASGGSKIPKKAGVPMGMPPAGQKFQKTSGVPMDMPPAGQNLKRTRPRIYYGLIVRYRPLRQKLHPRYQWQFNCINEQFSAITTHVGKCILQRVEFLTQGSK